MTAAAISASEIARLGKLAEYQILDTPPEREFDEITEIAARLIGVPISLVTLVDRHRQWFKARYGLAERETPREHAFCAHAIEGNDVYVVNDATQDPLFADNPLVTGAPDIRFYAGAPLMTPDNFRLGTLCVIDTVPHESLSEDAEAILTLLARMVVNALEGRRQTLRAQHQARMMTKLAETVVILSQAGTVADAARLVTAAARTLVVADVARIEIGPEVFAATRSGQPEQAPLDWAACGAALLARRTLAPATLKDLPPAPVNEPARKGAWIGFTLGLSPEKPLGHFQLWRQYTTSFTDLESAMLGDLARVAGANLARLAS